MITTALDHCASCYGTGETVTEQGPRICPDCFGEGRPPGRGAKMEWRLRQIEQASHGWGREAQGDVEWLVHELRRTREALVRILARCQDADDADPLAVDVKYQVNEVLGLYDAV
jgi:hypothetical protein